MRSKGIVGIHLGETITVSNAILNENNDIDKINIHMTNTIQTMIWKYLTSENGGGVGLDKPLPGK